MLLCWPSSTAIVVSDKGYIQSIMRHDVQHDAGDAAWLLHAVLCCVPYPAGCWPSGKGFGGMPCKPPCKPSCKLPCKLPWKACMACKACKPGSSKEAAPTNKQIGTPILTALHAPHNTIAPQYYLHPGKLCDLWHTVNGIHSGWVVLPGKGPALSSTESRCLKRWETLQQCAWRHQRGSSHDLCPHTNTCTHTLYSAMRNLHHCCQQLCCRCQQPDYSMAAAPPTRCPALDCCSPASHTEALSCRKTPQGPLHAMHNILMYSATRCHPAMLHPWGLSQRVLPHTNH